MTRRWRVCGVAVIGALALVLAGCGDDGGDDDATDETTTTEADETTTEAPEAPGDSEPADDEETTTSEAAGLTEDEALALGEQLDLEISDFAGFGELWTSEPNPDEGDRWANLTTDDVAGPTGQSSNDGDHEGSRDPSADGGDSAGDPAHPPASCHGRHGGTPAWMPQRAAACALPRTLHDRPSCGGPAASALPTLMSSHALS